MHRLAITSLVAVACGGGGTQLPLDRATEPGAALFNGYTHAAVNCFECHGGRGEGTKWGPALAQRVPKLDDARLRAAIVTGKGKMPAFRGKLADAELDVLVAWLRARFDRAPAARAPAPAPVYAPPDPRDACTRDDDCVVTNFAGCCACPQCANAPPYGTSARKLSEDQAMCNRVDCVANQQCDVGGACPPGEPAENFVARCRDRYCVAERR